MGVSVPLALVPLLPEALPYVAAWMAGLFVFAVAVAEWPVIEILDLIIVALLLPGLMWLEIRSEWRQRRREKRQGLH